MKDCESFVVECVGVRDLLDKGIALIRSANESLPESYSAQISTIDLGLGLLRHVDSILKADH